MERKEYLESMGVRAARRAFFSYTTEPEGSYSIHRVFIRFLEVNRMDMGQAEKPKAAAFLTDYILLRIYVAKYVLAGYAETYAPLLDLFCGFEKVEKKFSLFMERETAPGHGAERKFLPPDLQRRYDERGMRKTIELFDSILRRYEEREDTPERVMKCIVDECLSTIAIRNEISLSAPSFWLFTREMNGYIRYLNRFYSGLIPPAIHERIKAPMMEEETRSGADEESGGFNYERAAYIIFAIAGVICALIAAGSR